VQTFDVIVLGAGGVGSAALWQLARRGVRVLGLDRFHPPHDRGSTHGQTRIIRQAYFEHPDYVPLVLASYELWRELEHETDDTLFVETGLIQIGPAGGEVVAGVRRAADIHGLPIETMTALDIEQRWPGFRVPADLVGAFDPRAGYLRVEACVRTALTAAKRQGAELLTGVEVEGWHGDRGGIRLRTSLGSFGCGRLVITAGAWAGTLLADLGLRLSVLRKSMFWFPARTAAYDVAACPTFLCELPEGIFYGFPRIDERGVKVAEHTGGRPVDDPLHVDRAIDHGEAARAARVVEDLLPGVSSVSGDHSVCLYTMTPDTHFIVDRHPAHGEVVFAAGLSGHGFKFAPALGVALADLACEGRTGLPVEFLSLRRFRTDTPHRPAQPVIQAS
jgi:sarcosine oxidase